MYLTHGSRASVEGFAHRDGRRGARGTEDHREVSGIGDSSESLVGSDPGDIAGKQQPRTCRADAAPHDGRRPGRGQEGAGCQRRFPVITARSMECSSEPGVIAAGLPAASFARPGRGGADRSHRAVPSLRRQLRSLGRHALGSVLAGLAVLVIGAPEQANAQTPNTPATGVPTITGTAQVGQTLTASPGTIADTDGLTTPNYTYQWIRVDGTDEADLTAATTATYTMNNADLGKTLKVRASFTDDAGNAESRTSAPTVTVTAAAAPGSPKNLSATVGVGQVVLVWEPPDSGERVSHYEYRSSAGAMISPGTMWQQVLSSAGTLNQAYYQVVKGLTSGTTHTFQVRAVNPQGGSAPATVTATPISQPSCTIDELGGRRLLWQGQLVAGVQSVSTDGSVSVGNAGGVDPGTLTPDAVTFRSTTYSVTTSTSDDYLNVVLRDEDTVWYPGDEVVDALRLHVCNTPYDFSSATVPDLFAQFSGYRWNGGFNWPPGIERTLRLSLPPNHAATGDPVISGTAQAGQELTADASPILDADGLTSVSYSYQWVRVDADGMSNPADITDATAATYTLTADDAGKTIKVQVSFTDELSGEEERTSAAYPSSGTVTAASTTAPALLSVTVTSTPHKESDTYGAREHIEFSMTFDAPVTVTGAPTFAFDLGGATTATWYAGSGTTTLRFSHAVSGGSSGDEDTNGISWAATAIALNGGTIAGTDNAVAAVLTHAAQSNLADHKVDGRTTAVTAATVTVAVTSTPTSLADTYGFGETIVITVTASEAVEVVGDPEFEFSLTDMGGAANDVPATYDRTRSSPTTMVFTYTVQAGDRDNNGIWIGDHSRTFMLDANDRIRTASQQIDIDRSHPEKSTHADHKVNGSLGAPTVPPDPTAPTLVSATATTLTIEWTHPGDGGSPLTRNFIEYRVEGTTDWTNWYRGETPTTVTRTVITNLAAATAYDVRVHATNAIGNSQWVQSATAFSTLAGTASCPVPTFAGRRKIWTGVLTMGDFTDVDLSLRGYHSNPESGDGGGLDPATFTLGSRDYDVRRIALVTSGASGLHFIAGRGDGEWWDSTVLALRLHVCNTSFDFSDSFYHYADEDRGRIASNHLWTTDLDWSGVTTRTVHMSLPLNRPATGAPVITGPATVGQELAVDVTGIEDEDGLHDVEYTYQWVRVDADGTSNEADITDATADTYTLTDDDLGKKVKIEVSFPDDFGSDEQRTSAPTETVTAVAMTTPGVTVSTTALTVTEEDTTGDSYTVVLDSQPTANVTVTVAGHAGTDVTPSPTSLTFTTTTWGTAQTVTVTADDDADTANDAVTLTHSAASTDTGYEGISIDGVAVTVTDNDTAAATGAPTITGTAQVGETLTAVTTGIMDADGLTSPTYTYQWIRVDGTEADIASANSSTYILVDADLGTTLKVRVTFADDLGHTETLTSAATATVGAAATGPPTVNDVAVTSTPASGTTYYLAGEVIEFTVTFSAPVTVTATPKFAFRLGAATRQAAYASGSGSAALVFARTVQAGEVDRNGISWNALALALDGGTITQTGATTAASLTHAEQAPLEGHRVDAAPPMQVSASVHGMSLVLVYDEALDPASMPATGAYTVTATVGATTTNPAVSEVSIYGIWVTLALDAAPAAGATVTLAYAPPASNPVQDEAGNDAPAFSGQSVRLGSPPPPPPPVTDLEQVLGVGVAPGNAQLVVTWTAVDNATGYTVQWTSSGQGYNTGDRQATVTTGSTTRYTIPSLTNGTPYTVRVIATRTGADDGPPSDEMTGTPRVPPPPPPPVTDLAQVMGVGVVPGNAQLVVTWTAVSNATGYTVQWMSSGQGYNIGDRQATVTTGSTTRYTIPSLTNGTPYTVRVIATRTGATDGPPSDEMTGTPRVPPPPPPPVTDLAQVLGVGVVPGNAQLVVTWTAVSNATGYTVQWMSGGQGYNIGDRQATVTTGSTTRYTIPSLTNGTEYTVRVIATRTGADDGPPSDEVKGTPRVPPPPPPPVTDLEQVLGVGVVPGNAQLVVTWTAVSTATGYTVQWMSGGQGYNIGDRQATVTTGSTTRYTIPSLTNGTEYTVRVIATRTGADDGPPSDEVKGTPFTTPGAPQHLRGEPGDAQVTLTWDAPSSDGGSAILRYEYAIDDSGTWIDAGLDLEETVPGLTNGQQYAFDVRAVNSAGPGAPARTAATPLGMPSVPESLTATGGDGEVVLEWSAPADDGGSPVTGYGYRYAAGQAVPEDVTWRDAGTELTATVSGLENETRYTFEVRARNRVGPGETSGTTALPLRLRAELFSSAAAEGEALVLGVRRSGRLAFPAHAYIGVTDSALPGVTATEEGRDDGLGRHRLEFAAGAAEATVTVTVAFDGERRQDRVLTATLDSAELEVDGVRRPYELVTPTLVVPVTEGDAGLSVADARVQGKSSVLAFTVSMDRTRDVAVRVDYATEDGAARAGEDYTPVSGTLTIEAGGRERTVEVPVLPALHVTGERTLTLRLSNAVSAVIDDGVATGVIVRESELPKAWLARFGRTASDHAAQAIARRLEAGQRETQVTVAGRRVDGLSVDGLLLGALPSGGWRPASAVEDMATRLAAPALAASGASFGGVGADPGTTGLRAGTWGGAPGALDREPFADAGQTLRRAVLPDFGYRLPGAEEALLGTSFYVERGAQQDVGGGTWAAWGDVAATRFEGDAGGLALNGDVVTGTAGLDRQWRAVLVGLALSRSSGEGGYGTGAGTIASTLTSVHPYVQVRLGERAQVWGAAGWGRGGLEITPESGAALEADLMNSMAAAGARAVLMGAGGLEIALRSDFLWTETSSDGTAALAEAVGTASRGRLMLEGAGQIQGLGGVVRPKVEGGVRYDGGDAETGRGFEVGGGLDWARGSLTLQLSGRMLVAHADESYEEWGYSGSLVYEPGADGLGLQMRVGSSAGAAASGIRNLWALENASGLVRGGAVPFAQRFDAEVGYGLGSGTLWYPYFVADDSGQTRYGLKLSSGRTIGVGLEFGRRESVDLGPEDAMLLRGELRF